MRIAAQIYLIFLLILVVSCNKKTHYVIETDFKKIWPDTIKSQTVAESEKQSNVFIEAVYANTVGKTIPTINIFNTVGESINLIEILIISQ